MRLPAAATKQGKTSLPTQLPVHYSRQNVLLLESGWDRLIEGRPVAQFETAAAFFLGI